ncbi:MAG: PD-(D/E)XK nuclease family protein, partial [Ruminiclostridium sp.]|nr:PD-(D/E)XK nuclease family protein [Ruminiclostridium sp.]
AIEKLNGCKFAYFCRYGLSLRSASDITMNSGNYGNIMHYVMKYCFERIYADKTAESNPHVQSEEIKELISEALDENRRVYLLPESEMSVRFNTLYDSMAKTAYYIILYMTAELEKSSFKPMFFELKLERGKTVDGLNAEPYSFDITLPDGTLQKIGISGTVDRVDIAQGDSTKQLRVIDYKTGPKKADIKHVYYGLDLQLLLYLFALCDSNSGLAPSAAVYYPAGKTPLKDITAPSEKLKRSIWLDTHRENGFAVEGTVYEKEKLFYSGITTDSNGNEKAANFFSAVTVNSDKLDRLKERVLKVVKDNLTEVKSGNVSAIPLVQNNKAISCEYCDFSDVCGISDGRYCEVNSPEAEMFEQDVIKQEEKKDKKGGR